MADKSVGELIAAKSVTPTDLFVLEQNGTAKKLSGQILENWLVSFADGHGGIQSIAKLGTSGLADTYRITLADTTTFDFVVTNGRGVNSIAKKSTSGLVDTYQINYSDGTTGTLKVTNGAKGDKGDNAYIWIKYASQKPTSSSVSLSDLPDEWIGIYTGTSATAPTSYSSYKWYQIKGEQGDTGAPATLVSSATDYQASDSGTVIPSGTWLSSVPVVAQGRYLWTRTTNTFNTGAPAVSYSVSRMGLDGSGSVASVANISPDESGNVPLKAEHIGALSNTGGDLTGELKMNGQPISGLAQPTTDDQAANMGFVHQQTKKVAPRNLLDNSDFSKPVNQRGQTSYAGAVRCIDRWEFGGDRWMLTVDDGCIKVSDDPNTSSTRVVMLKQTIDVPPSLRGKKVTFAAKLKGNSTCRLNFNNTAIGVYTIKDKNENPVYTDDEWHIRTVTGTIPENADTIYVALQSKEGKTYYCEWVALYEGEYTSGNPDEDGNPTVNNLPEYQPKGYGAELAECQRYYQVVKYGYGSVKSDGTSVYTVLPLCVPMRKGSISVAKHSVASVRANGLRFDSDKITGATIFDYHKDTTSARIMVEGTFTGSENHIAYVDCTIHLSAEDL